MKSFIWNSRGLGEDARKRLTREMVVDRQVDFLGLQKTMPQTYKN
jgi:hypothetical protein